MGKTTNTVNIMGAILEFVQKSSKSMTAIVGSARITPITGSITFAKRANLLLNLASKKPKIKENRLDFSTLSIGYGVL